jgi:hypothetical protein
VPFESLVLPSSAQSIRPGVKQRVQRFFHRRPHHLVQVGLNPPRVLLALFFVVPVIVGDDNSSAHEPDAEPD